jgi:hypothetical protein
MIKTMSGFANEPSCIVLIISDDIVICVSNKNLVTLFLEIAKLLCASTFLNTDAMCHMYIGMVLRNEAGGCTNA